MILVHLKKEADGPTETRREVLGFCREFKEAKRSSLEIPRSYYTLCRQNLSGLGKGGELLCGFLLFSMVLKLPSTFGNVGFTRNLGRGERSNTKALLSSFSRCLKSESSTPFTLETSHLPATPFSSDHKPLGMSITARTHNRQARRRTFEATKASQQKWGDRIPTNFYPCPAWEVPSGHAIPELPVYKRKCVQNQTMRQ